MVAEEANILCDRFHYMSHKCSACYDPDSHPACGILKTTGAEVGTATYIYSLPVESKLGAVSILYARSLSTYVRILETALELPRFLIRT